MRWKLPNNGDIRVRTKFAWFPIEVQGYKLWLELYEVKEMYVSGGWILQDRIVNY